MYNFVKDRRVKVYDTIEKIDVSLSIQNPSYVPQIFEQLKYVLQQVPNDE